MPVRFLTSFLLSTTNRCLQQASLPGMTQFVLHCTHGKVLVADVGEPFLVVILDQFADLQLCQPDINVAVHRLTRLAHMDG